MAKTQQKSTTTEPPFDVVPATEGEGAPEAPPEAPPELNNVIRYVRSQCEHLAFRGLGDEQIAQLSNKELTILLYTGFEAEIRAESEFGFTSEIFSELAEILKKYNIYPIFIEETMNFVSLDDLKKILRKSLTKDTEFDEFFKMKMFSENT